MEYLNQVIFQEGILSHICELPHISKIIGRDSVKFPMAD